MLGIIVRATKRHANDASEENIRKGEVNLSISKEELRYIDVTNRSRELNCKTQAFFEATKLCSWTSKVSAQ